MRKLKHEEITEFVQGHTDLDLEFEVRSVWYHNSTQVPKKLINNHKNNHDLNNTKSYHYAACQPFCLIPHMLYFCSFLTSYQIYVLSSFYKWESGGWESLNSSSLHLKQAASTPESPPENLGQHYTKLSSWLMLRGLSTPRDSVWIPFCWCQEGEAVGGGGGDECRDSS